jgi:DNA-binding LytR/AlgR family response regulator
MTATSVLAAEHVLHCQQLDGLFIRISVWDNYQRLVPTLARRPSRVVFLSQRRENCTEHLAGMLDAHLKPPYSAARLARIWDRLSSPTFQPRPLDFFFLKTECRYSIIRYGDLRQVRWRNGRLQIYTRLGDYEVAGSLLAFQARLPTALTRASRNWLVNETYQNR